MSSSSHHTAPSGRFVFISSNTTWGGSEELWAGAAATLADAGHKVTVFKPRVDRSPEHIQQLRDRGCRVFNLTGFPLLHPKIYALASAVSYRLGTIQQSVFLYLGLLFMKSDLIVLSQGGNHDGLQFAWVLRVLGRPYVLIAQKAADMYWPMDVRRKALHAMYAGARAAFFVSEHNRRLTEEQIGANLPRALVVRNPFAVPWEPRHDWPGESDGFRFACIGRLYPMEKGQDLLLRVLARDKWRRRPLSVTFYGIGANREGLEAMARHHGLTSVRFAGFTDDVPGIWDDHHGLILPSRCEGLPLVLVEAMLSGRVSIVTDVAGNGEVLADGRTGFLATAPTEDALDQAMERAWQRRHEWRAIGAAAAECIRMLVPPDPAAVLASTLERLAAGEVSPVFEDEIIEALAEVE